MRTILGPQCPVVTEVSVSLWQSIHHSVRCRAPQRELLNIFQWNCLVVHEKAGLWAMGAGPREGHQGKAFHPAIRHAQDVSEVSQYPLECFFVGDNIMFPVADMEYFQLSNIVSIHLGALPITGRI